MKISYLLVFTVILLTILIILGINHRCTNIGSNICDSENVKTCSLGNEWVVTDVCNQGCSDGHCKEDNSSFTPIGFFNGTYSDLRLLNGISDKYVQETSDFDYSKVYSIPKVMELRDKIINMSVEKAVREIGRFTYDNVNYDVSTLSIGYCELNSASKILINGKGVCSTMTKVNIALLRGIGIASRPVVGCLVPISCKTYSIYPPNKFASTIENGRIVFGGSAHAWVEVWLPNNGWTLLESTTGLLYPTGCIAYDKYVDMDGFNYDINLCSMTIDPYGKNCEAF